MSVDQPMLSELMTAYLRRKMQGTTSGRTPGDVEPYDAVPGHALDAQQTWTEANSALAAFGLAGPASPPVEWAEAIAALEPEVAVPFAAGHFPQAVRDLARLARAAESGTATPATSRGSSVALDHWIEVQGRSADLAGRLLAAGVLRMAGQLDRAGELLQACEAKAGGDHAAPLGNERAALLWRKGEHSAATELWNRLPDHTPILFNRGLAALFLGDKAQARLALDAAVKRIAETSGWQHLGRLYLALAQG